MLPSFKASHSNSASAHYNGIKEVKWGSDKTDSEWEVSRGELFNWHGSFSVCNLNTIYHKLPYFWNARQWSLRRISFKSNSNSYTNFQQSNIHLGCTKLQWIYSPELWPEPDRNYYQTITCSSSSPPPPPFPKISAFRILPYEYLNQGAMDATLACYMCPSFYAINLNLCFSGSAGGQCGGSEIVSHGA